MELQGPWLVLTLVEMLVSMMVGTLVSMLVEMLDSSWVYPLLVLVERRLQVKGGMRHKERYIRSVSGAPSGQYITDSNNTSI